MKLIIKYLRSILIIFLITIFTSACFPYHDHEKVNIKNNTLIIHYIDVGQGDCILIQSHNKNMLIDAGTTKNSNKLIKYLKQQHIKSFNYVIATHPHEDHIGGMNKIINTFKIDNFYAPKVTSNTDCFNDMINSLKSRSLKVQIAKTGITFNLEDNIKCEFLAPTSNFYEDLNNYSAVIKIIFKNISFLFTGDAQKISENEMIKSGFNLKSNVLKVGHHGSRSSTSEEFLKKVSPNIAVISCGQNNDFGHPHKPTLTKLESINCKLFRTDKNGTIILYTDGFKITKK